MNRIRKTLALSALVVIGSFAFATEHAEHETGIPWKSIVVQLLNLGGLLALLGYLLRKTLSQHFSDRQKIYLDLVSRSEAAREQAEKTRQEVQYKLEELENSSQASLKQAAVEAEELKTKITAEARSVAAKLKEDTERSLKFELERAKNELRAELLAASVESARQVLKDKVNGQEQTKLQSEFAQKIQAVQ